MLTVRLGSLSLGSQGHMAHFTPQFFTHWEQMGTTLGKGNSILTGTLGMFTEGISFIFLKKLKPIQING